MGNSARRVMITRWIDPAEFAPSMYAKVRGGTISGADWCLCEIVNLAKKGVKTKLVEKVKKGIKLIGLERC